MKPEIIATTKCAEFTWKATILGVFLAIILSISNTFLALKIGVLTASSIPAAMLSMAVLRLFKSHTILENNLVQTCASSGEAIAGGIVYTAPGLVIMHIWNHFSFGLTFLLTWIGGGLGVLLIIPLRRKFMSDHKLRFPEAQAISQVLIAGTKKSINIKPLITASFLGALFEIAQNAIKVFSDSVTLWISKGQVVFGFGCGFSATLLGAGYLTGPAVCASIFIGAVLANLFMLPVVSWNAVTAQVITPFSWHAASYAQQILASKIRYVGIGAMLSAGVITLLQLLKPFYNSLVTMFSTKDSNIAEHNKTRFSKNIMRTDRDMPKKFIVLGCLFFYSITYLLLFHLLSANKADLGLTNQKMMIFALALVLFVAVCGYVFSVICAYFSGLVGVTASPGSSVAIATVLLATLLISFVGHLLIGYAPHAKNIFMALTIVLTCMIMGSAAVANNNSQDLKVGYQVGATPWKQQLMLLLGVSVASCVVPYVMQLLLHAYGIVGLHATANSANELAAPPAAAIAAIAQAAFSHQLPINDLWYGAIIIITFALLKSIFYKKLSPLSLIGVAIGIYLPLTVSTPLCIGGLVCYLANKNRVHKNTDAKNLAQQQGVLIACGLVAGAAVMNVILAIPASFAWHGLQLNWGGSYKLPFMDFLAAIATFLLARYLYKKSS